MGAKSKDPENACSVNTASRRSHKAGSRELPGAAWRMTQPESYGTARQAAIKAFTAKDAKSAKESPINMDRSRPRLRLLRLPLENRRGYRAGPRPHSLASLRV